MRADLLEGLDLPRGWAYAEEQIPGTACLLWERTGLELVVQNESVTRRSCLAPRFQLFDVKDGGFAKLTSSDSLSDILVVFDRVRASR